MKKTCCRLCSLEVDTETEFGVHDVFCERKWEESRIGAREKYNCDSGLTKPWPT